MTLLSVRRARPGDAKRLVELARAVGGEPEGWLIADGEWRTVREERRYLGASARSRHTAVLVAELGTELVGRLTITRDSHPACGHVADVGVMVARQARRQGVGTALLQAAEEWAASVGIDKVELHVWPRNTAAIALYRRLGYADEGLRRRHFRRGERLEDALLMAKLLR